MEATIAVVLGAAALLFGGFALAVSLRSLPSRLQQDVQTALDQTAALEGAGRRQEQVVRGVLDALEDRLSDIDRRKTQLEQLERRAKKRADREAGKTEEEQQQRPNGELSDAEYRHRLMIQARERGLPV